PLPYPRSDRIVQVWQVSAEGSHTSLSDPNFDDLRAANRTVQDLAEYNIDTARVRIGTETLAVRGAGGLVEFFRALGGWPPRGTGLRSRGAAREHAARGDRGGRLLAPRLGRRSRPLREAARHQWGCGHGGRGHASALQLPPRNRDVGAAGDLSPASLPHGTELA